MAALRPFFSYYGSKWRLASKYPAPEYGTIVEPFAGSAGYSLRHPERDVILIERDPIVASVWRWLISASSSDISSLPRLTQGETLDDYDLPQEAKWLMGFWINQTGAVPSNLVTKFGATAQGPPPRNRCDVYITRIVGQLEAIRHWQVIEGDYSQAPDVAATWFIDPPYQLQGYRYRFGPRTLDYSALAEWCLHRKGQVIACENAGATWLPFESFTTMYGVVQAHDGKPKQSTEVIWVSDERSAA